MEKALSELIACAQREAVQRETHYPGMVEAGKIPKARADHEIICMREIAAFLTEARDRELELPAPVTPPNAEDVRLLRRYAQPETYLPAGQALEEPVRIGAIVDTETTGLDVEKDEIVELGVVIFEYDAKGRVGAIIEVADYLREPTVPMSAEAERVTGIRTADLAGKSFPLEEISDQFEGVSLIIAHHANFDRQMCERMFGWAVSRPWACSLEEIPWRNLGAPSASLETLCWWQGFFYDAHRADSDCLALLHLLATAPGFMPQLIESARQTTYRIWATGAPFERKDDLKARGYRWHDGSFGRAKCWFIDRHSVEEVGDERTWLKPILGSDPLVTPFRAGTRYSRRVLEIERNAE